MIRAETQSGWLLITHPDHARLAGQIAEAWGNDRFTPPEPFASVLYAVHHHDDGWLARDAAPFLTRDGKPEAFTRTLVGAYTAFEEIDLPRYLEVRRAATDAVAAADPFAGVLVSLHSLNLLTEQADLASIRPEHRDVHRAFVEQQRGWQETTARTHGFAPDLLRRGFEFLQTCDHLSLILCADYREPVALRHAHPDRSGQRHTLACRGAPHATWRLDPWPFAGSGLTLSIPCREIDRSACANLSVFRQVFAAAPVEQRHVHLKPR